MRGIIESLAMLWVVIAGPATADKMPQDVQAAASDAEAASTKPQAIPKWAGIWKGTVGDLPVMVCLKHRDWGPQGAYYYKKHLAIIKLNMPDKTDADKTGLRWFEGYNQDQVTTSPQWSLQQMDDTHLSGTWAAAGSGQGIGTGVQKTLPIALTQVLKQSDDDNALCGGTEFNGPRATPITITRKAKKLNGFAYTELTANVGKQFDVAIATFELPATTPAMRKINAILQEEISAQPLESHYFECVAASLDGSGSEGNYGVGVIPVLISRNYMVSEESQGDYCGGAHPNYYIDWRNWDLRTGEKIDLWSWMGRSAVVQEKKDEYTAVTIRPALRKALIKKWKVTNTERECDFVGEENEYWTPHLTRQGISFYSQLAHAVTACEADIDFSFAEIAPLLSPTGKKAMAAFRSDLK